MMKKMLILLLCLLLCCGLVGCGGQETAPADEPASPTDIAEKPATATLEEGVSGVAEAEEAVSELEKDLDITIELPEDFLITRSVMVDEVMAQIEFTFNEENYTGRYAVGLHENMSGFETGFRHEEFVEINGVQTKLRWSASDEVSSAIEPTIGVADAYDQGKNLSYMVVMTKDSSKDKLVAAMEAFMQAASLGAPEEMADAPADASADAPAEAPAE